MIVVINYSDEKFEKIRKQNTITAYKYGGADKVIEFSPSDIDSSFREQHKDIFAYKRGAGLWIWKPYIIKKTLSTLSDDDWLLYGDSGSLYINKVQHLISCANANRKDILLFGQPLLNRQFTKREAFIKAGVVDNDENQFLGGYILLRKTMFTLKFIDEWLHMCCDVELLAPDRFNKDVEEWNDFIVHREDQSVLTLLCIKKGIKPFRDPSDYGLFPKMYSHVSGALYVPFDSKESSYPTIVLAVRKADPKQYLIKYFIKRCLSFFHLYNG